MSSVSAGGFAQMTGRQLVARSLLILLVQVFLLSSSFALTATAAEPPEDEKRRIEITDIACGSGDLDQAIRLLEDLIRDTHGKLRADKGMLVLLYRATGNRGAALPVLEQSVKEEPTGLSQALLGDVLLSLNRPKEAVKYMRVVLDEPALRTDLALVELGIAYQMSGDIDKAIETYKLSSEKFPTKMSTAEARAWGNLLKHEPECAKPADDYFPFSTAIWTVKWSPSRMPLKVFIDESAVDPSIAKRYRPELVRALDEWTTASHGKITFTVVPAKEGADIDCKWLRPVKSSNTHGHTQPIANSKDGIVHADITLDTTVSGEILPAPAFIHLLCLHEFGHALGLMHSPNSTDLMCPIVLARGMSDRDKATLLHLYRDDVPVEVRSAKCIQYEDDLQHQRKMQSMRFLAQKDIPGFMKACLETIDADPTTDLAADCWNFMGVLHMREKHAAEAELCFKSALAVPKQSAHHRKECLTNYAVLLNLQGKLDEAVRLRTESDAIKEDTN